VVREGELVGFLKVETALKLLFGPGMGELDSPLETAPQPPGD
jgi:hypothetical protein